MTTPQPVYAPNVLTAAPGDAAQHMEFSEKARIRAAAGRARLLHPGPVGEVLAVELLSWEETGLRLSNGGRMHRLVEHLMAAALPAVKPRVTVPATVGPSVATHPSTI